MSRSIWVLVVVAVLLAGAGCHAPKALSEDVVTARTEAPRAPALVLEQASMEEAVQALRDRGVPVCLEAVPVDPARAHRAEDGRIVYERHRFDLRVDEGTVPQVLDALVACDPAYRWERVGNRPTWVVYPAGESALDWTVAPMPTEGVDWVEALRALDLEAHQISLFPRGLDRQPAHPLHQFSPGETEARHWLAALVDAVDSGTYWTLAGIGANRSLAIGQVPLAPSE